MSRVITFSRVFPSYHPKAGQPTYFVEKILRGVHDDEHLIQLQKNYEVLRSMNFNEVLNLESIGTFTPKHHTIRGGHRWKVGDWFSPRVWSGKPYNSKMIQFAPDIEIKKVWNFVLMTKEDEDLGNVVLMLIDNELVSTHNYKLIAANDGFIDVADYVYWFTWSPGFKTIFDGQIICWNESIEY